MFPKEHNDDRALAGLSISPMKLPTILIYLPFIIILLRFLYLSYLVFKITMNMAVILCLPNMNVFGH